MSTRKTRTTKSSENIPTSRQTIDSPASKSPSPTPLSPVSFDIKKFQKQFEQAYHQFYHSNGISAELEKSVTDQEITLDQFDKLTLGRQYQRYISLYEGKIRFHELPNKPHGEIVSLLNVQIASQLGEGTGNEVLIGCSDNGMSLTSFTY